MAKNKYFEPEAQLALATQITELVIRKYHETNARLVIYGEVHKLLEPHIRKPSDDDKSVPKRCEQAYNEAIRLLENWEDIDSHGEIKYLKVKTAEFLQKPNPFKEAEIVEDKMPEPQLLPFDLKAAQEGAKVVTHNGETEVKIVADNISSSHPILATYTGREGGVFYDQFGLDGCRKGINDEHMNLFILKEPETVNIWIGRNEATGKVIVNPESEPLNEYHGKPSETRYIKTVTVQL